MNTLLLPTAYWNMIKAADERPVMYVEPFRANAQGGTGWKPNFGYKDTASTVDVLNKNPGLAGAAAREESNNGIVPLLAGGAAGTGAFGGAGWLASKLPRMFGGVPYVGRLARALPAAGAMIRGRSDNWARRGAGKVVAHKLAPTAAGVVAGSVAGSAAHGATADAMFRRNPQGYVEDVTQANSMGQHRINQAINNATRVRVNPIQDILHKMHQNPEARNALIGMLLGTVGGGALGSAVDSPWLGMLLGAVGGGALGGFNPQFGQNQWNDFYTGAWDRLNAMNNQTLK